MKLYRICVGILWFTILVERRPRGIDASAGQQRPACAVATPVFLAIPVVGTPDKKAGDSPPAGPEAEQPEKKISPQEAEELFRSVDEILKFVSKDTSLQIKEDVKRKLVNRDEVVAFIRKHMDEDEDSQRLRRSELVLKKFGLLPRNFDLQTFLLALLREQVAGYYDPKTEDRELARLDRGRAAEAGAGPRIDARAAGPGVRS